ncbi:MAG: S8 family serine peptidase, partial [Bdellovibrio sp.]|nr:S8 family serine peptidase [Bdellovibrio sp.]
MQVWLRRLTVSSTFALFAANTVQAGTVLRLNSGSIDPAEISKNFIDPTSDEVLNYIVQFKNIITTKDQSSLSGRFEVLGYLPDDALVVRGSLKDLAIYQVAHPEVRAIAKYEAQYKISNDLGVVSVFDKDTVQSVLIKLFKEDDAENVTQALGKLKVGLQVTNGKYITALVPRGELAGIASYTGVEHIQATPEIREMEFVMDSNLIGESVRLAPGDYTDIVGDETGTKSLKFDAAWSAGFNGKNQTASMADTGLDSGDTTTIHPDFNGAVHSGYFFGLWSKSWSDPMGHGTHVAGSIVSRGVQSQGKIKGGAHAAQFVAEGMWSPMLNGLSVPSNLGELFRKAASDGASVHSNSWGAARSFGAYDAMAVQVDEWMYGNPDTLVLFAAGNSGTDKDKDGRIDSGSMTTPGTAKNCLTVGASKNNTKTGGIQVPISKLRAAKDEWPAEPIYSSYLSDRDDGLAMFSSRGPTNDGRVKPDIVAPGTNILSTRSHVKDASPLWGAYNDDYAWSGGTSMATPLTAGAVTVARQILQDKWSLQTPSAAMLKAIIVHTADDLFPGQFGAVGADKGQELLTRRPNSDEGYGRVDMANLVSLGANTKVIDNRDGVAQGSEVVYDFDLQKSGRVYANLVWTDAPGSPNAAKALVNDLDLVLTTPDGQTLSMNDHINNLEMIEKEGLPAGHYKLAVKGFSIPQG